MWNEISLGGRDCFFNTAGRHARDLGRGDQVWHGRSGSDLRECRRAGFAAAKRTLTAISIRSV
jgi:hypothetical protein